MELLGNTKLHFDQIPNTSRKDQEKPLHEGFQEKHGLSVADVVRQTVNDFIFENSLPGFVFIDDYQMYYSSTTGYYYDPNCGLFYHPANRCYYYFDEQTNNYHYHSRYPSNEKWTSSRAKRHALSSIECVCKELSEDFEHSCSSSSTETEDEVKNFIKEERLEYGACIRLIEVSDRFQLHIITIDGAVVGSGANGVFVNVLGSSESEAYAHITYDEEKRVYILTRLGELECKVNGTSLPSGQAVVVNHGDQWSFAQHVLIPHIHFGSNTCPGCEPGLLQVESTTQNSMNLRRSKEKFRKRELRRLKAEYGLLSSGHVDEKVEGSVRHLRNTARGKLGENSDKTPSMYKYCSAKPLLEQLETAARPNEISERPANWYADNKGMKLLKGMGWKDGMGLGRELQGITEPIVNEIKTDRSGLGMRSSKVTAKNDRSSGKYTKESILSITRERFNKESSKNT